MSKRHPHVGHPGLFNALLEARSVFELLALPCAWPFLAMAPRGDGHPVLLLPGFMGSEVSLIGLQVFLRGRGYDVQTWGLGRTVGFRPGHASAIEQKIRAAVKAKTIPAGDGDALIQSAMAAKVITADEASALQEFVKLRNEVVRVDDFPQDFGRSENVKPVVHKEAA